MVTSCYSSMHPWLASSVYRAERHSTKCRAKNESDETITRVGIVLNGNSHLTPKTNDAHDYALHLFNREADFALDATSAESGTQLSKIINGEV